MTRQAQLRWETRREGNRQALAELDLADGETLLEGTLADQASLDALFVATD